MSQEGSKWIISYNLLTNGVNWGYNPVTNHLLTSSDIQVVVFWWFPPEWMFAVALFWPVEKAQESWVLPGEYVDERQHHGVNKRLKTMMTRSWFQIILLLSPRNLKIPIFDLFLFNDVEITTVWRYMSCLLYLFFMFHWFFTTEESCRFLVGLKGVQIYYEKQLCCYCWYTKILFLVGDASNIRDMFFFFFRDIFMTSTGAGVFGQQVWKLEKLKLQENTCSLWNLIYMYVYLYIYHSFIYTYLDNISIEFQIQKC